MKCIIVHLYLLQYKAYLIKQIFVVWSDLANKIVAGIAALLYVYAMYMYIARGADPATTSLYFGFVVIVDIVFVILSIISLRRYVFQAPLSI